jgi:hypothetical protein
LKILPARQQDQAKPSPCNPDGYTLLLGGTNVNAIIGASQNLGFDPSIFAPIFAIVDLMTLVISPRLATHFSSLCSMRRTIPEN